MDTTEAVLIQRSERTGQILVLVLASVPALSFPRLDLLTRYCPGDLYDWDDRGSTETVEAPVYVLLALPPIVSVLVIRRRKRVDQDEGFG